MLEDKLACLPHKPGVYQFYDASETVIYVGKAKDLKKRVSSYFASRADENRKLKVMVRKIVDIKHIVTPSESDALLLENNLIKQLQPRYNILLKDDKSYPWICIYKENFPRVRSTRRYVKDGSKYFGPYTSSTMVRTLLELIGQLYKLRSCTLPLHPEAIAKGKYKVCLEYHIGNCLGPCEGLQTVENYQESITAIRKILRGDSAEVLTELKAQMQKAATDLNFEEAQLLKEKLLQLENYQAKSVIVNPDMNNIDVISLIIDNGIAFTNFLRVVRGAIIQSQNIEIKMAIEEQPDELLSTIIAEMQVRFKFLSREIIVPFLPSQEMANTQYIIPQRGDKLKLLELSERNARMFRLEGLKQLERLDPEKHTDRILGAMQKDLRMNVFPQHIECFDNSNIQGTNPVAACVVFRDAKPAKKDYRLFNIKTVVGPDDYASMEEIVYRRYKRMLDEETPLPQLIVVDGGKGQVHAAVNSLTKLNLIGKIPILGLAERLEEIYFPGDPVPLHLSKNSETLKVLIHMRDEAHRFGLTFHRNKRSADMIQPQLLKIAGIGDKTATKLMLHFKTVNRIKAAPESELTKIVGKHVASLLINHFQGIGKD